MGMSEVNVIFYDLIDLLYLQLSATEKYSFDLREYVYNNIHPLWLKKLKSLYFLKLYVLSFVTWLDHSILTELVTASGSEDAQQLLNLFDSKISSYCNQPITSFPILSPSQLMIPLDNSDHSLLAIKFHPPSRGDATQGLIILQDVLNIKIIMKQNWEISNHEINSIQLVAVHAKLELLYWIIPKCLVEIIEKNLFSDWKSGIIMVAALPINFNSFEDDNSERFEGPFSSLWQDDTEVASYVASSYSYSYSYNFMLNS